MCPCNGPGHKKSPACSAIMAITPVTTNTIQYNTIQYNTIQYNTIQYNTMQCNAIQSVRKLWPPLLPIDGGNVLLIL
jgi:hypothetical protein